MKKRESLPIPFPKELLLQYTHNFSDLRNNPAILSILGQMIENNVIRGVPHLVYQPYSREYKKKIVGDSNLYKNWNDLVTKKVIQEKTTKGGKTYSTTGQKCKHLRLNPLFLSSDVVMMAYRKSSGMNKPRQIEGALCQYVVDNLSKLSFRHLSEEEEHKLSIRLAAKFMSKHFRGEAPRVKVRFNKKWREYSTKSFDWRKYLEFERVTRMMLYSLKRYEIESGRFYAERSPTNNRLNHNLTNCDKLIVEKMLLNNEAIVEFDLANAQPLLLSLVLKGNIRNNFIEYFNTSMLSINLPLLCSEIDLFHQLCSRGELYKYFQIKLSEQGIDKPIDEIKVMFIAALYGSNDLRARNTKMLSSVFPTINNYLKKFKVFMRHFFDEAIEHDDHPLHDYLYSKEKGWKNSKDASKDYLSIFLQRTEANIFIDGILADLKSQNLITLPKHDSILCPESQAQSVQNIMTAKLDSTMGVKGYLLRKKFLVRELI